MQLLESFVDPVQVRTTHHVELWLATKDLRICILQAEPVRHRVADRVGRTDLVLALLKDSSRIVIFDRQIDQRHPWFHGWVDTYRCQKVLVNLQMVCPDISFELLAVLPLR